MPGLYSCFASATPMSWFLPSGPSLRDHNVGTKTPGLIYSQNTIKGHQGKYDPASLVLLFKFPRSTQETSLTLHWQELCHMSIPKPITVKESDCLKLIKIHPWGWVEKASFP